MRFISVFFGGFSLVSKVRPPCFFAGYLVAGADWSGPRPSRSRGIVCAESPCRFFSDGHDRVQRGGALGKLQRGIYSHASGEMEAKSKNLRPGEGLARFTPGAEADEGHAGRSAGIW